MKTLGEMQRQQRGVAKDRFMVITGKAGLVLHRTGCHCGCSATKSCTTLWPHGLQHSRLPYPSPSPGACSHSCPLSGWCHPTILSSVAHFSSCPRSFLASGSFPVSHFFASSGQVLQLQHQSFQWIFRIISFRIDLIPLLSRRFSTVFSSTTFWKHQFFGA